MPEEKTVSDLPDGWRYEGFQRSRDPRECGAQAMEARKLFEPGGFLVPRPVEVAVQASSADALVDQAERMDRAMEAADAPRSVLLPRSELKRVLDDNAHMARQVGELQAALTLKEEQLRAHRRVPLSESQREALLADLEATTRRVRDGYKLPEAAGLSEVLRRDLEEKARSILEDTATKQ